MGTQHTSPGKGIVSLSHALSKSGVASRSESKYLIAKGAVQVNGHTQRDPQSWLNPLTDRITVHGSEIPREKTLRYVAFHKPPGYVTTLRDELGRATVYDVAGEKTKGLSAVGRLDKDTSGLLLFTNDHDFADRILAPKSKIAKTYRARLRTSLSPDHIESLLRGVMIKVDGCPCNVRAETIDSTEDPFSFEIMITEGRNHQIKKMIASVGNKTIRLHRISIGGLRLGDLPVGKTKELDPATLSQLIG